MSPQELQDLVDRFGEDSVGWPAQQRSAAEQLIDDCAEAKAIIAQAKALRRMLHGMGARAPACFTDRIVAVALELDPPFDWRRHLS